MEKAKQVVGGNHSHWPALAGGDGEEREERPENVVVVKVVLLPLPGLGCYIILVIVQKMTPGEVRSQESGQRKGNKAVARIDCGGFYLQSFSRPLDSSVQ